MLQNKYCIKNLSNYNLKHNISPKKKSSIYQINCKDCKKIYIEETKRDLETRVKEHFRNIKSGEIENQYEWKEKYAMDHKPVLLIQA